MEGSESKRMDGERAEPETRRSQVAQRHFDPEAEELTTAIIFAVAEGAGVEPGALDTPLYEVIDAAALQDTFFGPEVSEGSRQGVGSVEFRYEGYHVAVESNGWIRVQESTDPDQP
jgi:hypothetical protein